MKCKILDMYKIHIAYILLTDMICDFKVYWGFIQA